jgi:hypothetical protein
MNNSLSLKRRIRGRTSAQYQKSNYYPIIFIRNRLLTSLNAVYNNIARFGDRYHILFYEVLIYGGNNMVRELASWLGLTWHESLLISSRNGELWGKNPFVSDLKERPRPFDTRPKAELSDKEISLMEL